LTQIVPTLGRVVLYCLTRSEAVEVNTRRKHAEDNFHLHAHNKHGVMLHCGNNASEGQICPAIIVAVWGVDPHSAVNLKVLLDGSDDLWVTSTQVEQPKEDAQGRALHSPGKYHWMVYQLGQAAKTEAATISG
jgi:hypothetical protein